MKILLLFLCVSAHVIKEIPDHVIKKLGITDPKDIVFEPSHKHDPEELKTKVIERDTKKRKIDDEITRVEKWEFTTDDLKHHEHDYKEDHLDEAHRWHEWDLR